MESVWRHLQVLGWSEGPYYILARLELLVTDRWIFASHNPPKDIRDGGVFQTPVHVL
jgi:hypothetical protein